ncbi:type II secretion system F family protein [Phytoactinopolyspora mesophila]|nr:type II secretion system F family protein [Phytoactinopolyspora mesophila]
MNPLLAALTAIVVLGGAWAVVAGLVPVRQDPSKPRGGRLRTRIDRLSGGSPAQRRQRAAVVGAAIFGALIWLMTGWILAIVVMPVAVAGLPAILQTTSDKAEIARLEAMSAWTRDLAGVIGAGIGIEQAIRTSLVTTAAPIRTEVGRLVARLEARWSTDEALRAFADDLDDPTGDLIASALILGAQRRGAQLSSVLTGLADTVADDVRMRRDVSAEQARPRSNARIITLITSAVLLVLFAMPYSEPYRTPLGQMILAVYLALYGLCLVWLRSITKTPRQPRILGAGAKGPTQGVGAI